MFILIPENNLGIGEGYHEINNFCQLLRKFKGKPEAIQFLADMLEQ